MRWLRMLLGMPCERRKVEIPVRDGLRFGNGRLQRPYINPTVGQVEYRCGFYWGLFCGACVMGWACLGLVWLFFVSGWVK